MFKTEIGFGCCDRRSRHFVGGGFQRSHGFELFPSLISMNTRLGRSRMRSASHSPHCQIRVWGLPGVSGGPLLSGPRPATVTPKHEVRESKKNSNKHVQEDITTAQFENRGENGMWEVLKNIITSRVCFIFFLWWWYEGWNFKTLNSVTLPYCCFRKL